MLSFSECLVHVCVFCLYIPVLSLFFVFHGKNFGLLNLIKIWLLQVSNFWKEKTLWNSKNMVTRESAGEDFSRWGGWANVWLEGGTSLIPLLEIGEWGVGQILKERAGKIGRVFIKWEGSASLCQIYTFL